MSERAWPRNPFKKDMMRRQFASLVYCYFSRDKDLVRPDGSRHLGNSQATNFWRGFDNVNPQQWDSGSREMLAYAAYRAGQAVAAYEASISTQPT